MGTNGRITFGIRRKRTTMYEGVKYHSGVEVLYGLH